MPRVSRKPYVAVYREVVRRLPILLLISFVAAAVAYGVASSFTPAYQVHFSYLISLREREASTAYRFDGYYALQATDLFAATLASWAKTPEIIVAAHEVAGLKVPTRDPRTVASLVAAQKSAPQLVEITVRGRDEDTAQKLAQGLQRVLASEVSRYHQQGVPAVSFSAVPTQPWVGLPAVAVNVIASAVFIFTLVMAINVVIFKESFRFDT